MHLRSLSHRLPPLRRRPAQFNERISKRPIAVILRHRVIFGIAPGGALPEVARVGFGDGAVHWIVVAQNAHVPLPVGFDGTMTAIRSPAFGPAGVIE